MKRDVAIEIIKGEEVKRIHLNACIARLMNQKCFLLHERNLKNE